MIELIGYIASIFIGISLGIVGSGGSILTIPVLVYLFSVDVLLATSYSLFIVGISALVGSLKGLKDGLFHYKIALYFGIPSTVVIFLVRYVVLPYLPNEIIQFGDYRLTKEVLIMILFALVMIMSSFYMIRGNESTAHQHSKINAVQIVFRGIWVGLISGLVGVGGGFLIIPVLLSSTHLTMKETVSTSLFIISINALIGFLGSVHMGIDWTFLFTVTMFSLVGIFLGTYLSKQISNKKLKPAFGVFILLIGFYVLVKEMFFT